MRKRYKVGLAAFALVAVYALFQSIRKMLLSGRKGTNICPQCGSPYIHLSSTRAYVDLLFRIFGCLAYRCQVCNIRFYRPRVSTSPARGGGRSAPPPAVQSASGTIEEA